MRPRVICHMMSSLDGSIDGKALRAMASADAYEEIHEALEGDAWMCGRVTLQKDFAKYMEPEDFDASSGVRAGKRPVHVARRAKTYAVAADTHGVMRWKSGDVAGDALVVLTTETAAADYLALLEERGVSYVVEGAAEIDFAATLEALRSEFGIERLLLEGGGHFNAGLLQAGLVDELSLLLMPGVDGRKSPPAVFDGLPDDAKPTALSLESVERRNEGVLWLRYAVKR